MRIIVRGFFKGLLIVVPIAVTAYVLWFVVTMLDDLLARAFQADASPFPGFGLLVVAVATTLVGLLASNVIGRKAVEFMEKGFSNLPVVKIVYGSIKDLMGAFVGDKKSFDRPVMVQVAEGMRVFGFVTCSRFDDPKLYDHVAVYLPQSYNFAGNLIVVHKKRVEPIDADGAQFMAFVVSGGVSEMSAARTMIDGDLVR